MLNEQGVEVSRTTESPGGESELSPLNPLTGHLKPADQQVHADDVLPGLC